MDKKQIIMVIGVAIILLIGGSIWINSQKPKEVVTQPSKTDEAKKLIDKLYLLDHNGGVLMSDDARRIFNANVDVLKSLSSRELDGLIIVLNKMISNTASDSEKEYLNELSDKLSL
jgi:hypothetical protein